MTSSLVGSEMCIRDRLLGLRGVRGLALGSRETAAQRGACAACALVSCLCLLYTSDAADDM
eukprot:2101133-Prorocentrum_lima.AAC.1